MIDDVCNRLGTSTTTPVHFTRPMVATWMSEAQRTLCSAGPVLKSYFRGSSVANVEILSLPFPDFFKVCRLDVRRSTAPIVNKRLRPMTVLQRPADRTSNANDVPDFYCVWSGVDGSGNAKKGLMFDKNFGTSGTDDLYVWVRQVPKEMVDGAQGPEVDEVWQDALKHYAEMLARGRMAAMDSQHIALGQMAERRWLAALDRASNMSDPEFEDEPITTSDEMGLLDEEYPA